MLIFCSQPNLFILKLKCVKVLELVFQKRVFPYYIWILIIYCSFKKKGVKLGGVMVFNAMAILFIGGVYRENHRPAASLTNFIRNGVSSNKGVLIADIYIRTTVYKFKEHPPEGTPGYRNRT